MKVVLQNLKLPVLHGDDEIYNQTAKRLKVQQKNISSLKVIKKSIDARKKSSIFYVYNIEVNLNKDIAVNPKKGIVLPKAKKEIHIEYGTRILKNRPIVVGAGPAGLFCALYLAKNGYNPLIIERGSKMNERVQKVNSFIDSAVLDTETNMQFGEGGAGTFSDGKLNTLIKNPLCYEVLKEFVNSGAHEEVLYLQKPHIGTDLLRGVIVNLRNRIISLGGEFIFDSKLTNIEIINNQIVSIELNNNEKIKTDNVFLGIGHSARDTFELLVNNKLLIEKKNFAIGVRIEQLQEKMNIAQYGDMANVLPPAEIKAVYHGSERSIYTFCMCPGGEVVCAASENDGIVVNGMSRHARNGKNANMALLANVGPQDFFTDDVLAGVKFQQKWERLAFNKNYKPPTQLVGDFLGNKQSNNIGSVTPSCKMGYEFEKMDSVLPDYITSSLRAGIVGIDEHIKGFAAEDGILTGVETRSSSPVRILRDETGQSNIKGIYPIGEGAGYAGGIVSAAVDGIKTSIKFMRGYRPIKKNK